MKVSMHPIKSLYLVIFYLCMQILRMEIWQRTQMDCEYSHCNYATIAFIDLKLQKTVMMKYLLTH